MKNDNITKHHFFKLFFLLLISVFMNGCIVVREKVKIYYRTMPAENQPTENKEADNKTNAIPLPPPLVEEDFSQDLLIAGYLETVAIGEKKVPFSAKLDTGADTCSLGADNIKIFQRDGKKWVRFRITNEINNVSTYFEKPIVRRVRIKRHNMKSQRRVVIKLPITLNRITLEREFSLTERGKFSTPVLLGRNFLNGIALVDASQTYIITKQIESED